MDKSQKPSVLLREFLGKFRTSDDAGQLRLLACTLELFRQASTPKKDPAFFRALAQLTQKAGDINWGAVPFSITQAALSRGLNVAKEYGATDKTAAPMVSAALILFADLIENGLADSDVSAQDIFDAVIAEVVESPKNPLTVNPVAPEIYNERMLARVFNPAQFTDTMAAALSASLVSFRDKLPSGEIGPAYRGLSFDNGTNTHFLLLETGEFFPVSPRSSPAVTGTNTAEDYASICPALLAYVSIAARHLEIAAVISEEQRKQIERPGYLGEFTKPAHFAVVLRDDVASLERVIAGAKEAATLGITGATGAHGAAIQVPVPATDYVISITAAVSSTGPYVVATLLHADRVVMRLERPRQFSARGVYLFPLTDCVVSLTVIY
ncbi:hypothetical protein EBZ39_01520 [bacterium]|nr:hypothetical protein [bacterium]